MRAVVQRVKEATVSVNGRIKGRIEKGLLLYACVEKGDTGKDAEYIACKLAGLRIFEDRDAKMNLDIKEAGGSVLAVSQFETSEKLVRPLKKLRVRGDEERRMRRISCIRRREE